MLFSMGKLYLEILCYSMTPVSENVKFRTKQCRSGQTRLKNGLQNTRSVTEPENVVGMRGQK
jgi:hypothetical protein